MSTASKPKAPAAEQLIPLSVPEIAGNEWKYIKECLDTGWSRRWARLSSALRPP